MCPPKQICGGSQRRGRLWPLYALAIVPHVVSVAESLNTRMDKAAQPEALKVPHDQVDGIHFLGFPAP